MSNANTRTKAWRVRDDDFYDLESRAAELEFLLQYAILAPSGHNTQPWSFKITSVGVEVYVDESRAMPYGSSPPDPPRSLAQPALSVSRRARDDNCYAFSCLATKFPMEPTSETLISSTLASM